MKSRQIYLRSCSLIIPSCNGMISTSTCHSVTCTPSHPPCDPSGYGDARDGWARHPIGIAMMLDLALFVMYAHTPLPTTLTFSLYLQIAQPLNSAACRSSTYGGHASGLVQLWFTSASAPDKRNFIRSLVPTTLVAALIRIFPFLQIQTIINARDRQWSETIIHIRQLYATQLQSRSTLRNTHADPPDHLPP